MSDLSPQSGSKRTMTRSLSPIAMCPERTLRGPKSCSAAVCWRIGVWYHFGASAAPELDSEQIKPFVDSSKLFSGK